MLDRKYRASTKVTIDACRTLTRHVSGDAFSASMEVRLLGRTPMALDVMNRVR